MRIMGLDVGSKTVGVAVSDALGWTAQGVETVKIDEENGEFGIERISELVQQYGVTEFVVGFPKNMNNTIGPRGEASQAYAKLLEDTFSMPVTLWDERLTTMAAARLRIEADVRRKNSKKVIDKMAAVMILQGFLDRKQL